MQQNTQMYGYAPPTRVSRISRGVMYLFGAALFCALTQAFLIWIWGTPPGVEAWVSRPAMRRIGLGAAIVGALLLLLKDWRLLGATTIPVGALLSLAPLYSPLILVRMAGAGDTTVLASCGMGLCMTVAYVSALAPRLRLRKAKVKGSTEWGKATPLRLAKEGFLLGRDGRGKMLRYAGEGHLMTVAATRGGKGVGTIMPNLLSHKGSLVCTDPKGENYFVTSKWRSKLPDHKVIALDPFDIAEGKGGACNPMDLINLEDPSYIEVANSMAENMLGKAHGNETHWVNEAKAALVTFILYVKSLPDTTLHNLSVVRSTLSLKPEELMGVMKNAMLQHPLKAVREGSARLLQKDPKELSGVLSTLQGRTHVFSNPRLEYTIKSTSFTKEELVGGKVSIYLIIPREHLTVYAPWLRLTVSSLYNMITSGAHKRGKPKHRTLFMLDEFANLGYMREALDAVSLGAGFGISLWLVLQDFAQLREKYKDVWESFVANCDVLQVFAIQDMFSCKQVSDMLGESTVWQRDVKREGGKRSGRLTHDYREESRKLLKPDEIRRLHPDRQILLVRPLQPVVADKLKYYKDSLFKGKFEQNPYLA